MFSVWFLPFVSANLILGEKGQAETMARKTKFFAAICVAVLIGGCSFVQDGLWPVLGEDPEPRSTARVGVSKSSSAPRASVAEELAVIKSGEGGSLIEAAPGAPEVVPLQTSPSKSVPLTGTYVGSKIVTLKGELNLLKATLGNQNNEFQQLLNSTTQNSQRYHAVVAAISARLQIGTTPGNPVLSSQWQSAQTELDRVFQDTSRLNELSNRIASNSALANYLVEATRAAYGIQGAVDEDHRQLSVLEDDVNRTVVSIERLLKETNETIRRQNNYATGERRNLTALALAISNGEAFGPNLSSVAFSEAVRLSQSGAVPPSTTTASRVAGHPPLVVIRFDRPDVDYQQALYTAVSQAIEHRPTALFDVVAVTPNRGAPSDVAVSSGGAKKSAEKVMRSLIAMGLSAGRVNLSSSTSENAFSNEVRIYIR